MKFGDHAISFQPWLNLYCTEDKPQYFLSDTLRSAWRRGWKGEGLQYGKEKSLASAISVMWIYGAKTTLFMFEWQCSVQVGTDCQPHSLASSTHHRVLHGVWKAGRGLLTPGPCSNNQSWTNVWNMKHALNKVREGIRSRRYTMSHPITSLAPFFFLLVSGLLSPPLCCLFRRLPGR